MSHWKNTEMYLGMIQAGSPKRVIFQGNEDMPKIKKITPYCGCTASHYNEQTKELIIIYSNGPIPNQVQGVQSVSKRIDIQYEDDTTEVLTIKATKIR